MPAIWLATLPFGNQVYVCSKKLSVEHTLSCPRRGFPTLRHSEVRDITAKLLTEVTSNVTIEPPLQPLSDEQLRLAFAITDGEAPLDIAAEGFWSSHNRAVFRVFNPFVRANSGSPPAALYRRHEREKIRTYEQRVLEVEHGSFTPLVLSATGGMAPLATPFYRTNRPRRGSATFRRLSAWSDASLHLAIACSGRRSAA